MQLTKGMRLVGTHGRDVEGFVLHREGEPDDESVVQIVGKIEDREWQDRYGLGFLIRLRDDTVTVAQADDLTPWYAGLTT